MQQNDLYLIQEKLGVLLQTKTLNPPSFFSFQFKVGVYLPILAPFVLPILMTIWLVLLGKIQKLRGVAKVKTE